jgi:MYXO-CTERM domain-containing protein
MQAPAPERRVGETSAALSTFEAKLVDELTGDGVAGDGAGASVAVSGDWAVVGAQNHPVNGVKMGAAYVFARTQGKWALHSRLAPKDGAAGDGFGWRVAMDATTIVVSSADANMGVGAAYVYVLSGSRWTEQAEVAPASGTSDLDFGAGLAIDGDTLAVGADGQTTAAGAVYVFTRAGTTWSQQARLSPATTQVGWQFGWSVALEADLLVVGNIYGANASAVQTGTASIFERAGTTWTQTGSLSASDGMDGDEFGWSVSCAGDTVVVGAPQETNGAIGSAYVYTRGTSWAAPTEQKLSSPDQTGVQFFGNTVRVDATHLYVAAPFNYTVANPGKIYEFVRSGAGWDPTGHVVATSVQTKDVFGFGFDWDGSTLLVGADYASVVQQSQQGLAYAFSAADGTTWNHQPLQTSDGVNGDAFGTSVAAFNDRIVVGTPSKFKGALVGANPQLVGEARVFLRGNSGWQTEAILDSPTQFSGGAFGQAVALSENTAVVGASAETVGSVHGQGTAYTFTRAGTSWSTGTALVLPRGAANGNAGAAVAISNQTIIVGAPNLDQTGAVFLFERSGASWAAPGVEVPLTGVANSDRAGLSVAIDGDVAVVGAPSTNTDGAVFVLHRVNNVWSLWTRIAAPVQSPVVILNMTFGWAVAVRGSLVYVSAPQALVPPSSSSHGVVFVYDTANAFAQVATITNNEAKDFLGQSIWVDTERLALGSLKNNGSVQLFAIAGTTYTAQDLLQPADFVSGDGFGAKVALTATYVVSGSAGQARAGMGLPGEGAAYVYGVPASCASALDCARGFCVSGMCCDSACATGTCASGTCMPIGTGGTGGASGAGASGTGTSGASASGVGGAGAGGDSGASGVGGSTSADAAAPETDSATPALDAAAASAGTGGAGSTPGDAGTPVTRPDAAVAADSGVGSNAHATADNADAGAHDANGQPAPAGCGCRVAPKRSPSPGSASALLLLGAAFLRRRRARAIARVQLSQSRSQQGDHVRT